MSRLVLGLIRDEDDGDLVTLDKVHFGRPLKPVTIQKDVSGLVPHPGEGSVLVLHHDGSFDRVTRVRSRERMSMLAPPVTAQSENDHRLPEGRACCPVASACLTVATSPARDSGLHVESGVID